MTIKTRLDRAERAASASTHEDFSAAVEAHRQMILASIANMPEPETEASPAEQERLMQSANAAVKAIVAERKQANERKK